MGGKRPPIQYDCVPALNICSVTQTKPAQGWMVHLQNFRPNYTT